MYLICHVCILSYCLENTIFYYIIIVKLTFICSGGLALFILEPLRLGDA